MLFILVFSPSFLSGDTVTCRNASQTLSSSSDATVEVLDVRVYMVYTIAVSTVKRRKEKKKSRLVGCHVGGGSHK